jgi:hypothetical protein
LAKIESIGLVTELAGTGGSPEPGRQRDELISEIRTYNAVENINQFIDSPNTAMVVVEAIIPPGAREGDRVDLRVRPSRRAEVSSLSAGWLMPSRLRELRVLGGSVRSSDVLGLGTGPVVTQWDIEGGDDPQKKLEGIVVGGGKLAKSREVSLIVKRDEQHDLTDRVKFSEELAATINARFSHFEGSKRTGVAKPVSDERIELAIHPLYRRNISRYLTIIDRMPTNNEGAGRTEKLIECETQLGNPLTTVEAALTLEALGRDDGRDRLLKGLKSDHVRVRYASAEALAYLEDLEAIPVLAELARSEPELRHNALRALGIHPHHKAMEALAALLHEASNETRYGALRELMERTDSGRLLGKKMLPGGIELYLIPSQSPPLVTISTTRRAAIAIFGAPLALPLTAPRALGLGLSARPDDRSRLRLTRFRAGTDDRVTHAPMSVEGLIEGLCTLEVGYGALISTLRILHENGDLPGRLAIDPLPRVEEKPAAEPPPEREAVTEKESSVAWWSASRWLFR